MKWGVRNSKYGVVPGSNQGKSNLIKVNPTRLRQGLRRASPPSLKLPRGKVLPDWHHQGESNQIQPNPTKKRDK
jgi:hypothetical protein